MNAMTMTGSAPEPRQSLTARNTKHLAVQILKYDAEVGPWRSFISRP